MSKPTLFFNLSGPSGIGKTTTLRRLSENQFNFGLQLVLPVKVTTRAPKPVDNPEEMTYLNNADFNDLVLNQQMLASYERHGNRYGLLHPPRVADDTILIQAMPPAVSAELKAKFSETLKVVTVRLEADMEIVKARLAGRNDKISAEEMQSRQKTALKLTPEGIDHLIKADAQPIVVAESLAKIIKQYKPK